MHAAARTQAWLGLVWKRQFHGGGIVWLCQQYFLQQNVPPRDFRYFRQLTCELGFTDQIRTHPLLESMSKFPIPAVLVGAMPIGYLSSVGCLTSDLVSRRTRVAGELRVCTHVCKFPTPADPQSTRQYGCSSLVECEYASSCLPNLLQAKAGRISVEQPNCVNDPVYHSKIKRLQLRPMPLVS